MKEHLIEARRLVFNGWTKSRLTDVIDGRVCYCLDGAIAKACGAADLADGGPYYLDDTWYDFLATDEDAVRCITIVARTISPYSVYDDCRDTINRIWSFNDRQESVEPILDLLDRAIAACDVVPA